MRGLERRVYGLLRHRDAAGVMQRPVRGWDVGALHGHRHCLLVTWKRDGSAVAVPVWFALAGDEVVIRSGAEDFKVKRIRNNGRAAVAPCDGRGKPLGPPMLGTGRLLEGDEARAAERALAEAIGMSRRVYMATWGRATDVRYLAISR